MAPNPSLGSRALFPSLAHRIYANHASVSPLPLPAIDAMMDVMNQQATHAVAAMLGFHTNVAATRKVAGEMMGVAADRVAVVGGTSAAISAVATCIPWQTGETIVLFRGEFPANTTPWQQAARQHNLNIVWLDADDFRTERGLATLDAALANHSVRLVAVSAVQFSTGLRMPVEAMAQRTQQAGAAIFVDAIQALGATPFDTTNLDYVASGGQKWLMGPPGTGLLYARDWSTLQPNLANWLSHEDALEFLWGDPDQLDYDRPLQVGPAMMEGGTLNFAGLAGLTASMTLIQSIGVGTIHAHANAWNDRLEPHLLALGFNSVRSTDPAMRSTLLCVKPPPGMHAATVAQALQTDGISVATPDAHIRFSPSWPNGLDEPDAIVDTLHRALARG